MTIRALALWSSQWVPVSVRRDCLWWHDGPVGFKAIVEIEWQRGERAEAEAMREKLTGFGYRNVKLHPIVEVGSHE